MKSFEWDHVQGLLVEVDDPCYNPDSDDHQRSIFEAGFLPELDSGAGIDAGGSIAIYRNVRPESGKPEYYIDLWGTNSNFATFVARDFQSLIATLRHIEPMLTVLNLDQRSSARIVGDLAQAAKEQGISGR
jgi:hypothetical protein